MAKGKTMIEAITEAMDQEMARNDKLLLFGEDVGKNLSLIHISEPTRRSV